MILSMCTLGYSLTLQYMYKSYMCHIYYMTYKIVHKDLELQNDFAYCIWYFQDVEKQKALVYR